MNGIILLDKPEGWTSHDAVAKLRGILRERRMGHSGTLDPMATGLLVIFAGRATRAVEFAETHDKEYIAGLRLGLTTDTLDTTGSVLSQTGADISPTALSGALSAFRGDIMQTPPMYSAIRVNGRRLYEVARSGGSVEVAARPVHISGLELLGGSGADYTLRIRCSKGTYIRSLCADIGEALGCGGCMSSLRRVRAGEFDVKDAHTIEDVQRAANEGNAESLLLPVDSMFQRLPSCVIGAADEKKCRNGNAFPTELPEGEYRVYSHSGEFLMLGRCENGMLATVKSFFEVGE